METVIAFLQKITSFIITLFMTLFTGSPIPLAPGPVITEPTQTKIMTVDKIGDCRIVEGGCTDGEFIYLSLLCPTPEDDPVSTVVKINPKRKKIVKTAEGLHIDHANDMTYNPSTGEIVICNNMPRRNLVTFLDPETLEIKRTVTIGTEIFSIEYIPAEDCYYCGIANSYNFGKFTADFTPVETYTGIDNGFTRQSMSFQNGEFYHLFYKTNTIYKYDPLGRCTGKTDLPVQENEAEDLFFIGGEMYVTYNVLGASSGGIIYKVENLVYSAVEPPVPPTETAPPPSAEPETPPSAGPETPPADNQGETPAA